MIIIKEGTIEIGPNGHVIVQNFQYDGKPEELAQMVIWRVLAAADRMKQEGTLTVIAPKGGGVAH